MADHEIFREQLSIRYSSYGHALWEPSPSKPNNPVEVGDVGYIRSGRFHRLFNALLSAEDQSNVPEYHEQLTPKSSDHITKSFLSSDHYCSAGINIEREPDFYASGPDDLQKVSFSNSRRRGAVLSLPVDARREDTEAKGDFREWIIKHIDCWFAFARERGLGIERMEELILVTGCDHTRSWANVAFFGDQHDAQASFGVHVIPGHSPTINWRALPERVRGAVVHRGPSGTNLPEDQCIFIRGFRVARTFWKFPRRVKAAAGPSPDMRGYDCDPDSGVISIPATTKYQDPLHILQEYITEQAADCDMTLVHDEDLVKIFEFSHDSLPETLEPDVMMDLLRGSNMEIRKVPYDLSLNYSGPNSERSIVKVAMLSVTSKNWNATPPSQWSPLAARNIITDSCELSEWSPPTLPGSLPVPTNRGNTSERESSLPADDGDGALFTPQDLVVDGHATEDVNLSLDKVRNEPPNVWQSFSIFHAKSDGFMTIIVVTCCAVSLLGWVFSFTWEVAFKLFFTLVFASFLLSVWFEREFEYRRRFDELCESMKTLQHQVTSLQSNQAVPAIAADVRQSLPIMGRTTHGSLDMLTQDSMQIVRIGVPEGTSDILEPSVIDPGDGGSESRPGKPSLDGDSSIPVRKPFGRKGKERNIDLDNERPSEALNTWDMLSEFDHNVILRSRPRTKSSPQLSPRPSEPEPRIRRRPRAHSAPQLLPRPSEPEPGIRRRPSLLPGSSKPEIRRMLDGLPRGPPELRIRDSIELIKERNSSLLSPPPSASTAQQYTAYYDPNVDPREPDVERRSPRSKHRIGKLWDFSRAIARK